MPRKSKRMLTHIKLTGMHPSGKSFGYWGDRKVYTCEGIPGETVDMLVHTRQRDWLSGSVVRVIEPSVHRVQPRCRHASICGGCTWQHIDYQEQLRMKHRLLSDAIAKKYLSYEAINPVEPSTNLYEFRNKLDFSFSERRWFYENEGKVDDPLLRRAMGFHPADNADKVFDVLECKLMPDYALDLAFFVREYANSNHLSYFDPKTGSGFLHTLSLRRNTSGDLMAVIYVAENKPEEIKKLAADIRQSFPELRLLFFSVINFENTFENNFNFTGSENAVRFLTEICNNLVFKISPGSFYQPNTLQAENIYRKILQEASLSGTENVIDLYCGVGTISLHLARHARHVTGIEGSEQAVNDAKANAIENNILNTTFIHGDILETFTPEFLANSPKPNLIVLDPPRSGTLISIKKTILVSGVERVIYLSCNYESLANDLRMLCEEYEIAKFLPFDMFPHTAQVETLVVLNRKI